MKSPSTKAAVAIENSSPCSVDVQTGTGSQRRNRYQLCRRSGNQESVQPTAMTASSTLPKQSQEMCYTANLEESADDNSTSPVHQAADGPEDFPPDNTPVEQTNQKTVYTKPGRRVQIPQRLDL